MSDEGESLVPGWGGEMVPPAEVPAWMLDGAHFPRPDVDADQDYIFTLDPTSELAEADGAWVGVQGAGVPCPLRLRIVRSQNGRFGVNALVIGEDGRSEIGSELLRAIRIPDILTALFSQFDPWSDPPKSEPPTDAESYAAKGDISVFYQDQLLHWMTREFFDGMEVGPSGEQELTELERFAQVYVQEQAKSPRKAMTATARRLNISRATANRRAQRAREEGLLPKKEES